MLLQHTFGKLREDNNLVSSQVFAEVLGITKRDARKAFSLGAFRKQPLPVAQVPSQQGGKGGMVWVLRLDRCSPELQARFDFVEAPVQPSLNEAVKGHVSAWQWDEQADKHGILKPILDTAKWSPERAEAFRTVAAQSHMMRGKLEKFAEKTLRDWVRAYELRGMVGLLPVARSDVGVDRAMITRAWDDGIDLPFNLRAGIAARVVREARSMIFNDGTSVREVTRLASDTLCRLSAEAGSALPLQDLRALCLLNSAWAARGDLERYLLGYKAKKDHKAYQDAAVGRVSMALNAVPMDLVQGDVHYVDLLYEEAGKPVRVRLIAWLDMASLFLWVTPVLLHKGQGVVQVDVAEALFDLVACPHGGIPKQFYLDHGSEYKALAGSIARLSYLSKQHFGLTLAKPYSPTGKGSIEGLFHILEDVFKGLPGWIGGRRDNKKSTNKGKVVAPYRKGLDQFLADLKACVAIYNDRKQSDGSRIAGLSPKEVLELKAEASGFVPKHLSDAVFDLTFSKPEEKVVRQSAVTIENRPFHGDYLHEVTPGTKVEVLVPLRKGKDHAWINLPGQDPLLIQAAPVFSYGDTAGAVYQQGLEKKSNAAVKALAKDIDPSVSTFELQKLAADMSPPKVATAEVWENRAIHKTAPRSTESAADAEIMSLLNKKNFIDEKMRANQRRTLKSG